MTEIDLNAALLKAKLEWRELAMRRMNENANANHWRAIYIEDLGEMLDAFADIVAAHLPSGAWQPIETAPRDGTRIILAWGGSAVVGYYLDNSGMRRPWQGWRTPSMEPTPRGLVTHWMPLPPPPEEPQP